MRALQCALLAAQLAACLAKKAAKAVPAPAPAAGPLAANLAPILGSVVVGLVILLAALHGRARAGDASKAAAAEAAAAARAAAAAAAAAPERTLVEQFGSPYDEAHTRRFQRVFVKYDKDKSSTINQEELSGLLKDCGREASAARAGGLIAKHMGEGGAGELDFATFLRMVKELEDENKDFFGYVWYQFNSSNNLTDLVK